MNGATFAQLCRAIASAEAAASSSPAGPASSARTSRTRSSHAANTWSSSTTSRPGGATRSPTCTGIPASSWSRARRSTQARRRPRRLHRRDAAPRLRGRRPADRLLAAELAARQRARHRQRLRVRSQTRKAAAVHVHVRGLRQELGRPARRGRGPDPRLGLQEPLGLRDGQGLRRGARARLLPRLRGRDGRRPAVQHRRTAADRRVRDGAPAVRPPGARRRRPHRLRERHADPLLHPRRRHRPGAAAPARQRRRRRALYNVGSQTEIPVIELARRVIEATGSTSKIRADPV